LTDWLELETWLRTNTNTVDNANAVRRVLRLLAIGADGDAVVVDSDAVLVLDGEIWTEVQPRERINTRY
jgi:hypothetical protein